MTGKYAADTTVSVDRSIAELRATVTRYGATGFAFSEEQGRAAVMFIMRGRRVRIVVPLPDITSDQFRLTAARRTRTPAAQRAEWEKACRQRWRTLTLVVKAKLEAVETGIAGFDIEFLGYLALPGGGTVGEAMAADGRLERALTDGAAGPLLALPAGAGE